MDRDLRFQHLTSLAIANGGWATVAMAVEAGIQPATFYRHARRLAWRQLQVGVWALPGREGTWRLHLEAALARVGEYGAVSGLGGLVLHGLDDRPSERDLIVGLPQTRRCRSLRPPVRLVRSTGFDAFPASDVAGWPVADPETCLLHASATRRRGAVRDLATRAVQQGVVSLDALDRRLAVAGTAPGSADLRIVTRELHREVTDSVLERDVRRVLRSAGLHPAPAPWAVQVEGGVTIHLDIAFPHAWVAVEVDGRAAHGDATFERDRVRWDAAADVGWDLRFVTAQQLRQDPGRVAARLRRVVDAADLSRSSAPLAACGREACAACRRNTSFVGAGD